VSFIVYYVSTSAGITADYAIRSEVLRDNIELAEFTKRNDIRVLNVIENKIFVYPFRYPPGPVGPIDEADNWGSVYLGERFLEGKNFTGAGVRVGIADSGLDLTSACFRQLKLKKFVEIDKDTGRITEKTPTDSQWHGTFCTAILAGTKTHNFYRGMAPEVDLYVAKIFDNHWSSSIASVHRAFEFFIENKVNIVSMSLGCPNTEPAWAPIIKAYVGAGGILIAGIGNDYGGGGPTISPGNYPLPGIMGIGAHDDKGVVWAKSGGGRVKWESEVFAPVEREVIKPDLVAPGVGIMSIGRERKMDVSEGTSFATPHVSGLAACIQSAKPDWAGKQVLDAVMKHCIEKGNPGKNERYGMGIIDVRALFKDLWGS
jgi:subtilisin family serine protease